ncbi:DUF6283 family protein [Streptomyces sp. NPDC096351]|uniref:DUF6283 family protein n=1 Tax=Streptomyces sp. NPDC096351 TaxID=3366087 RepID=UPI003802FC29
MSQNRNSRTKPFQCHQADADSDARRVCAGWAGCHDGQGLLSLRLALLSDHIDSATFCSVVGYQSPVPLSPQARQQPTTGKRVSTSRWMRPTGSSRRSPEPAGTLWNRTAIGEARSTPDDSLSGGSTGSPPRSAHAVLHHGRSPGQQGRSDPEVSSSTRVPAGWARIDGAAQH